MVSAGEVFKEGKGERLTLFTLEITVKEISLYDKPVHIRIREIEGEHTKSSTCNFSPPF